MAKCRYCNKEITWLTDGKKKMPVESDGALHECDEYKKTRRSFKKMDRGDIDPELIKQYESSINNQGKK